MRYEFLRKPKKCQIEGCDKKGIRRRTTINMEDDTGYVYLCDEHWKLWQ